jgi:hypothetical protein
MTGAAGHETRDVAARPILLAAAALVVVLALVSGGLWLLLDHYRARAARLGPPPSPLAGEYGRRLPPEPRLQAAPLKDLEALRAEEDALLQGYAWVDRQAETVRIPIGRAIELLAEEKE